MEKRPGGTVGGVPRFNKANVRDVVESNAAQKAGKGLALWRHNRRDEEWFISDSDLVRQYKAWPAREDYESHRGTEWTFRWFIVENEDKGGLCSVFEEPDFQKTLDRVWKAIR